MNSNNISVFIGNGSGGFSVPINLPTDSKPFSTTIQDLNGDGKLDLVVPNSGSDTLTIFLGDGLGGFTVRATIFGGSIDPAVGGR
jgi:hypothetical protein